MTDDPVIGKSAALVVRSCQDLVDFEFGYDERSVAWLEGYIERLRTRVTIRREAYDAASGGASCT